jgi:predicted dienelactone hydrolase
MVLHRTMVRLSCAFSAAAALVWLGGCAGPRPAAVDAPQLQRFEARAYPAQQHLVALQTEELRGVGGLPLRLVWLRPQGGGARPLVIYMPGAGQDAMAHARWRRGLAEAGYAVLSWQPLPDDEQLPAGPDLHAWAAPRFGAAALARRAALLDALMAGLARAQAAGEPALKDVDLRRVALAGYELGAWTTLLAAGEQVRGAGAPSARFQAYLAISPHASFDLGGFDTRWREVQGPLLCITSDADADPFGMGAVPYLRAAPYGGMPPGQKWLLMLRGTSHDALGGRTDAERVPATRNGEASARREHASRDPGEGGGGTRPQGGRRGDRGAGAGAREAATVGRAGDAVSPTQAAMQEAAMLSVALAFLDATLDDDALARRWLAESAPRWLAPVADLQGK